MRLLQKFREQFLAFLDWTATQIPGINFDQVERAEHSRMVVTPVAQQAENRKPILVDDDGLAVNSARCFSQGLDRIDDQ